MFDPYTMVGIFGIGAYPFCFNIRMVSYAMFWAVLVLVPVGVNMVLKPFGTDKKTIIGILAYESSTGLVEGPVVG